MVIDEFLKIAIERDASDLHFKAGNNPSGRLPGRAPGVPARGPRRGPQPVYSRDALEAMRISIATGRSRSEHRPVSLPEV